MLDPSEPAGTVHKCVHTSTSSSTFNHVLGFSCLAGNARLAEIQTSDSNGKLEREDASRYLRDCFCLI